MRENIEKKSKTCSACLNAGKNLKFQIPQTKKSKIEPPKTPGGEIQIDFTGNLNNKKLQNNPFILYAVDKIRICEYEYAGRHREEIENLLSLPQRR